MCVDILSWDPDVYKDLADNLRVQLTEPAERSTVFSLVFAAPYGQNVRKPDKRYRSVHIVLNDPQLGDYRPFCLFESDNPNEEHQIYYETNPEDMMKMAKDINDWIGAK